MYNHISLGLEPIVWRHAPVIWNLVKWNSVKWNETRRIGAILHASVSHGFFSVRWAFLFPSILRHLITIMVVIVISIVSIVSIASVYLGYRWVFVNTFCMWLLLRIYNHSWMQCTILYIVRFWCCMKMVKFANDFNFTILCLLYPNLFTKQRQFYP